MSSFIWLERSCLSEGEDGGREGGEVRWRESWMKGGRDGGLYLRPTKGTGSLLVSLTYRLCTPRTKEMASIRLDLPLPFGPMMAVKSRKGPTTYGEGREGGREGGRGE